MRQGADTKDWKGIEDFFNQSVQLLHSGITVDLSDPSQPVAMINAVAETHRGGIGSAAVNGGVIAGMIDLAVGLLGFQYLNEGMTATAHLSIDFIQPLLGNRVVAQSRETFVGEKRVFGTVTVKNEWGEVCAVGSGTLAKRIK